MKGRCIHLKTQAQLRSACLRLYLQHIVSRMSSLPDLLEDALAHFSLLLLVNVSGSFRLRYAFDYGTTLQYANASSFTVVIVDVAETFSDEVCTQASTRPWVSRDPKSERAAPAPHHVSRWNLLLCYTSLGLHANLLCMTFAPKEVSSSLQLLHQAAHSALTSRVLLNLRAAAARSSGLILSDFHRSAPIAFEAPVILLRHGWDDEPAPDEWSEPRFELHVPPMRVEVHVGPSLLRPMRTSGGISGTTIMYVEGNGSQSSMDRRVTPFPQQVIV
ncbi:hypothetical protein GY45DRAFT_466585 [Cubamyces sp. BRFM 1775]|nr:hypothetical protein GY45DRAFT_466585 [Cubamyces sp. BRFM 1775]